jgi:hypothetical protein
LPIGSIFSLPVKNKMIPNFVKFMAKKKGRQHTLPPPPFCRCIHDEKLRIWDFGKTSRSHNTGFPTAVEPTVSSFWLAWFVIPIKPPVSQFAGMQLQVTMVPKYVVPYPIFF